MLKSGLKIPFFIFCFLALSTCIDSYNTHLSNYQSLLVIEGLVSDEKTPYEVRLSRTFQSLNSTPENINDAMVFITDESGNMATFTCSGGGIYKTDSALFSGKPGKTYTLHVETREGNKYLSEPCFMRPAPDIDSVYYTRDEKITDTQGNLQTGIMIYLDSDEATGADKFFRWEYEETWKFRLPNPKKYNYISENLIVDLKNIREYCWKTNKSNEILTSSILPGEKDFIRKKPVLFIASGESDRLTIQYSILIKQFSISRKEFYFWNNLRQVNEIGGDIFDTQPYPVISNIYNVDNPKDKVLGYFKVSAVKKKRIFITSQELKGLSLPPFDYNCVKFVVSPEDYPPPPYSPPMTFDEVYNMFIAAGGYTFVEPLYKDRTTELFKLVFVPNECSDCALAGSIVKPDFWIDLP